MSGEASTFKFVIDDAAVRDLFRRAPEVLTTKLRQLIEGNSIDVQREMMVEAPAGVNVGRGGLRGSVRYTFNVGELSSEIKPGVPYADPVETGSRPHWVSVRAGTPLYEWAVKKNINPFALQKSIAAKGTMPHPYIKPTYEKMSPKVQRDIEDGITKLVENWNNGRI